GKRLRQTDDFGSPLRLRTRMSGHDLHPEAAGAHRNRWVFDQIREDTMLETQGRRDSAHRLSSQQCRYKRSGLAETDDSRRGKRFTQNASERAHSFSQQVAFGAADDLDGFQDGGTLMRREPIRKRS